MKIKKFNESLDEEIKLIEDIMFDLKDEFGDTLEINIGTLNGGILLQIKSIDALIGKFDKSKGAIEKLKLVNKFQNMLLESFERIEEALDAKISTDDRFYFTVNRPYNCSVTWPEFFK